MATLKVKLEIRNVISLLLVSGFAVCSLPVFAQAIKKCQDADGNWHYGTVADTACADSVVDHLNESGTKVGEDAPPPSEEELERQASIEEALLKKKASVEEQRQSDLEILRIYGSEDTSYQPAIASWHQ